MKTRDASATRENLNVVDTGGDVGILKTAAMAGACFFLVFAVPGWTMADDAWPWVRAGIFAGLFPLLLFALVGLAAIVQAGAERLTGRDLNQSGSVGDTIRLVPFHRAEPSIDGCDKRDLIEFVRQIALTGETSQAEWRNRRLPSGKACDDKYHALLIKAVAKTGRLVPAGPRRKVHLLDFNETEVLATLGLTESESE